MRPYLLFLIFFTFTGWAYAQGPGSINNIEVSQRAGEEERVVDIAFTLAGGDYYAIKLGIKFHENDEFTPIPADEIMGLDPGDILDVHFDEATIGAIVVEGGDVELTWDGRIRYQGDSSQDAILEVTATRGLKDIDGNFYKSVLIDDQEWMAENLRTTQNAEGNNITRYCYDGDETNCELYGGIYTWNTIMNGESSSSNDPSGVLGICPTGWHVPSNAEWTDLTTHVGTDPGRKLKSERTAVGDPAVGISTDEHPRWNYHENNFGEDTYGFSALPGGASFSSFSNLGRYGYWWSATESSASQARIRYLSSSNNDVLTTTLAKGNGASVRCVRTAQE